MSEPRFTITRSIVSRTLVARCSMCAGQDGGLRVFPEPVPLQALINWANIHNAKHDDHE